MIQSLATWVLGNFLFDVFQPVPNVVCFSNPYKILWIANLAKVVSFTTKFGSIDLYSGEKTLAPKITTEIESYIA